jgi:hypothetical protein
MGLFKKPKAPTAPSAQQLQQANTQSAFQQAAFNRPNQSDQFGNTLNWQQTGTDAQGNPVFNANQQLGQTGQQYATGLTGLGQKYFDTVNQGADLSSTDAFNQAQGFWSANAEPRFEQQRAASENRLRNQGLDPTSEAYKSAMNDQALQQNEARNQFMTSAQGQFFDQGQRDRTRQLNELAPGMDFGNSVLNPSYINAPNVNVGNTADLMQQGYNNQYQQYQDQMGQYNSMLGGLAGLGGTAAGFMLGGPMGASIGGQLGKKFVG